MAGRRRRRWPSALAAAALAVALATCSAAAPAGRPAGTTGAPAAPTTTAPGPPGGFVRTCESSVYGDLGDGWRARSVVVGPLAFVSLRDAATQPASDFRRRDGRYQGLKALAVVEVGATVTVTVPAAERRHLSLLYDPDAWNEGNGYRVADGDTAVTFRSCPPAQTPLGAEAPNSTAVSWSTGRAAPPWRCPPRGGRRRGG